MDRSFEREKAWYETVARSQANQKPPRIRERRDSDPAERTIATVSILVVALPIALVAALLTIEDAGPVASIVGFLLILAGVSFFVGGLYLIFRQTEMYNARKLQHVGCDGIIFLIWGVVLLGLICAPLWTSIRKLFIRPDPA